MDLIRFFWAILVVYGGVGPVNTQVITSQLYTDLFVTKDYNSNLLPICENGKNVTVRLNIALRQVMAVDEKEQVVTVNLWFRMRWNDCRLKWNVSNHDDITYFNVPYDAIWVPDITSYDSAADEVMMPGREDYKATIRYDGSVSYNFPTVLKSICRIDVTYFPFDTQVCKMTFGSWSHHGFELDLLTIGGAKTGDLASYIEHNEWAVAAFPAIRSVFYYNCCAEPYPDVTFHLTLKRKARFYIFTVLFPCILTSSVSALGFVLPSASGEKVSLGVTVLLSLAVFLMMVSEQLPASADTFPYIGMYFAFSMGLVALSCFLTVLVLNIYFHGNNGQKVPLWVKHVVLDKLGYLVRSHKNPERFYRSNAFTNKVLPENNFGEPGNGIIPKGESEEDDDKNNLNKSTNDFSSQSSDPIFGLMREQSTVLNKLEKNTDREIDKKANLAEWHEVAFIMDRVFLFFYIFILLLTFTVFMAEMTSY